MTQDTSSITVSRTIDASTKEIFDVLTLPARHAEFDGSGMVRSDDRTQRLERVGDEFTMNMHAEHMGGDYRTINRVSAIAPNERVAWMPRPEGKDEPGGWEFMYELAAEGSDATNVTLTYDWSKVEDPKLKPIFPVVTREQLEDSLAKLAEVVAS